jgi:type I restriction enzyme M protein
MTEEEIARVAETYHAWRGNAGTYRDVPGFCKSTSLEKVRTHGYVLTPGRYVGAAEQEEDDTPYLEARLLKDRRLFFNSALAYLSSRE